MLLSFTLDVNMTEDRSTLKVADVISILGNGKTEVGSRVHSSREVKVKAVVEKAGI